MVGATKRDAEGLVQKAVDRDKVDQTFQSVVLKLTRSLKARPGGRRKWIFDQGVFGAYKPHRPILEMIDLCIEADAPEEDVEQIAQFFVDYVNIRYGAKELAPLSIKEALRLKLHADTEAIQADSDALAQMDPSTGSMEKVCDTTSREVRAEETLLSVCRRNIAARCMRLVPRAAR